MNSPKLKTNFPYPDFITPHFQSVQPNKKIPITEVTTLIIPKESTTTNNSRTFVEITKTGASLTQGVADGLYHATGSLIEGFCSGILSSHIAVALKVGKIDSYLSRSNITYLESNIFANNPYILKMAETHLNPWLQKSFNTSCLHWFFVGLVKAPILHLFFHPPKYAIKNGAARAAQVESAARYFGIVDLKEKRDPECDKIHADTTFFTACLVSGTISILTGAISYQIANSPNFPQNLRTLIEDLQEMGRKAMTLLAF